MVEKEEMKLEDRQRKKDRECGKCVFLFDCAGKALHVERCLNFKERKHGKK